MNQASKETQQLLDLGQRWAEAELHSDADALDALLHEECVGVGPLGFVLDKRQWVQETTYQGHDASGRFRVTQIAVRDGADDPWRIVGMHLSPIAAPPGS
jgi:hypothetical protein